MFWFVQPYDADVAELVGGGHGVVVEQAGRGHPARIRVVGEDDELVLVASVADPEQALLDVGHDHALANGVDAGHQVGNVLQRRAITWSDLASHVIKKLLQSSGNLRCNVEVLYSNEAFLWHWYL